MVRPHYSIQNRTHHAHSQIHDSPGLTSSTASLPSENLPVGTPVAVYAAGKELALGIGLLSMSTDDIKSINKNIGVENICHLGDDLWSVTRL